MNIDVTIHHGKVTAQVSKEQKQVRFITSDYDKIKGKTFRTSEWTSLDSVKALYTQAAETLDASSPLIKVLHDVIEVLNHEL